MSDHTYPDFPACLPDYAWLIDAARNAPEKLFNTPAPHYCKACGEPVSRPEWRSHVRDHARQLLQSARQREKENTARLRQINKLRAETRAATTPPPAFVPGAHQLTIEGDPS